MANGRNIDGRRGFWRILDAVNHPGRGKEQDNHDQYGDNRPGQLDLITPVHLGRFAIVVGRPFAKFHDREGQQAEDDEEYQSRNDEDEARQLIDGIRWCRVWLEDVGNRIRRRALRAAQSRGKEYADQKDNRARGPAGDYQPIRAHLRFLRSAQVFRPRVTAVAEALSRFTPIQILASLLETLLKSRNT